MKKTFFLLILAFLFPDFCFSYCPNIANCSTCPDGIYCTSCKTKFTPSYDYKTCLTCNVSNCDNCSQTSFGRCNYCYNNFNVDSQTGLCVTTIPYCISANTAVCLKCDFGKKLSTDGKSCGCSRDCGSKYCFYNEMTDTEDCVMSKKYFFCFDGYKPSYLSNSFWNRCENELESAWLGKSSSTYCTECIYNKTATNSCSCNVLTSTSDLEWYCNSTYNVCLLKDKTKSTTNSNDRISVSLETLCSESNPIFLTSNSYYLDECRDLQNTSNPCGPGLDFLFTSFDIKLIDFKQVIFQPNMTNIQIINGSTFPGNVLVQSSQRGVVESSKYYLDSYDKINTNFGYSNGISFNYLAGAFSMNAGYKKIIDSYREEHLMKIEQNLIKETLKITLKSEDNGNYSLDASFTNAIDNLPDIYEADGSYDYFISRYGTHYIWKITLGGQIKVMNQINICLVNNSKTNEFYTSFSNVFNHLGINGTATYTITQTEESKSYLQKLKIEVNGGLLNSFCSKNSSLKNWMGSVDANPIAISLEISNITQLISDPKKRNNLRIAIDNYLTKDYNISYSKLEEKYQCPSIYAGKLRVVIWSLAWVWILILNN